MITKEDISFIIPSRDNLKYLKWAYNSIRKNGGNDPYICVADDFSSDGTWDWCKSTMESDSHFLAIRNFGPKRLGHTILYDRLINEVAPTKVVGIFHADMYLCPEALESVIYHLKPQTVVSLTRIEPPLHPPGPEKVILDRGIEPETFKEKELLRDVMNLIDQVELGKSTEGIFAPWFLYKEDFQSIGGHDDLYAPQSKEDSDIFNRFLLNGYNFIQTWDGFVYHMTCRGSRFNPTLTTIGKESPEWLEQNIKSTRNFIRKWGSGIIHDKYMKPIVPHKYDIALVVSNCDREFLALLEPWFSKVYMVGVTQSIINQYIDDEQPNTKFNLKNKIVEYIPIDGRSLETDSDIVISLDVNNLTPLRYEYIQKLSQIIEKSTQERGKFTLEGMEVTINRIKTYENELIKINPDIYI